MRTTLPIALAAAALLLALPAAAESLDAAKAAGQVGEQADGYLGVVPGAPDAAQRLVASINAQRAIKYKEIALKNNTTPVAVAALAGQKLVARTPPGQHYRDNNGTWQRR